MIMIIFFLSNCLDDDKSPKIAAPRKDFRATPRHRLGFVFLILRKITNDKSTDVEGGRGT